jgi:FlaA1/EpsC-like NDP-sugar epimerase
VKKLIRYFFDFNKNLKSLTLVFMDLFFIFFSAFCSLSIITTQIIPISKQFLMYSFLTSLFYVPISYFYNNYNLINRFFELKNVVNLIKSSFLTIFILLIVSFFSNLNFLYLENIILQNIILFFIIINSRILIKLILNIFFQIKNDNLGVPKKKCVIYGAGTTGSYIFENFDKLKNYEVYCFVDDDLRKKGRFLKNIKINHSSDLHNIIKKNNINKVFISILNLSTFQKQQIYATLKSLSVDYEYLNPQSDIKSNLNNLNFERNNILENININLINNIKDKTVIVTGAAGSIGEELCFQLAKHVKLLVAIDKNELGISNLKTKLTFTKKNNYKIILYNLLNDDYLPTILENIKPDYIFHAAAYKHVDICEENPFEASLNNCISLFNILSAAEKVKIPNFTFISTDKAVNPINIMGKTKKFGEYLIKYFAKKKFINSQNYISVRFGNVLNSSGSLMPKIRNQIATGNNISITHKDVTRYFMTISDAVSLVLESSFLKENGNTFVLKMGKPVNIYNLAQNLLKEYELLQNKNLGIKINIIGLRPGEKLHEELYHEGYQKKTKNHNILVDEKEFDLSDNVVDKINHLRKICKEKDFESLNIFFDKI